MAAEGQKPGRTLRKLRIARGWTLDDVSRRTGLAVSTLSKIENDKMSLTFDKLQKISNGTQIDIADLFGGGAKEQADHKPIGRRSFTPAGQGKVIESHNYLHHYPAMDLLKKRFVPIFAEVLSRSIEEFGEWIRHPGEEFVVVLEGEVDLHTEYYAPLRLSVGDSAYFDSGMGHAYIAVSEGRCRVLSVCAPDEDSTLPLP